ncbi:TIR domain-containing protein [Flammeovirgaceae bacterium SG7u.111]|nr:TIR domain-containing protein [Flammeovirgaceae bacterium SG7u.132]WPO34649.1 TIR domain-containing protein [Flammeovirgaceae bacterium SG7u.111]
MTKKSSVNHKAFFISYSRSHSLSFAAKLHQKLQLQGTQVWFDKVNIPSGDDFQERINAGIRDAQNFLFVMSPTSITSPYCLAELEYAAKSGKRIFPLLHIEETETEGYTEEQANIRTQVFEIIGRRDWIYAREKMVELEALGEWKEQHENHWAQHQDKRFLETWKCPVEAEEVDTLESVVEKLLVNTKRHRAFVQKHTTLLNQAYDWAQLGKPTSELLVGKERQDAVNWLQKEFRGGELPPSEITQLQADYICASKKNGNNLMTEVFLSYSLKDKAMMETVKDALERKGVTTWLHSFDIDKTKVYEKEITKGIEEADNFLFFISKSSLESEWCLHELNHAITLNKRIIPLYIKDPKGYTLPNKAGNEEEIVRQLLRFQHVDFTNNRAGFEDENGKSDFELDMEEVFTELERDKEYYFQHKVLLAQALRWKQQPKAAFLLAGHNLDNAITWLRLHKNRGDHPPVSLHEEFISTSDKSKGLHATEVFISYSRKDGDFARKLNQKLQNAERITWFDQESIASGVDFDQEIFKGIERSFNFVFVITPDAVDSEFCERELEFAAKHRKRFIPILLKSAENYESKLPEAYKNTQWIDFEGQDFDKAYHDLELLLDTDREHVEGHVKWQQRALEWKNHNYSKDLLLNKTACDLAEAWVQQAEGKNPSITKLQNRFISTSRGEIAAIEEKEKKVARRLKSRLKLAGVSLMASLLLLVVAGYFIYESNRQEALAAKKADEALLNEQKASGSAVLAEQRSIEAQKALNEAKLEKTRADKKALEAELEKEKATNALAALAVKSKELREEKWLAEVARDSAEVRRIEAVIAKEQAIVNGKISWALRNVSISKDYLNEGYYSQAMHALIFAYDSIKSEGIDIPEELESSIRDVNNSIVYYQSKELLEGKELYPLEFSADGSTLLAIDERTGAVQLVNMEDESINEIYTPDGTASEDYLSFAPALFLENGAKVLVGIEGENSVAIGVYDVEGNLLRKIGERKKRKYTALAVSSDGQHILSGDATGRINLWDIKGSLIRTYKAHKSEVRALVFIDYNKGFVSGSRDDEVIQWDLEGKKEYTYIREWGVNVIVGNEDQYLIGGVNYSFSLNDSGEEPHKEQFPRDHNWGVVSVGFNESGNRFLASSGSNIVIYEDYGDKVQELKNIGYYTSYALFTPSDNLFVASNGKSYMWEENKLYREADEKSVSSIVSNWKQLENILPLTAKERKQLGLPRE